MRAVDLLELAISTKPESVLDVGAGGGLHSMGFISGGATRVVGIDPQFMALTHECYEHKHDPYESVDLGDEQFDVVWASHVLEHVPNVQHFLIHLHKWTKPDGWIAIAVPTDRQRRLHIGHLTLWTPAHLIYNMICAGIDCKDALWYTSNLSIGVFVRKKDTIDLSWRTSLPTEQNALNQFMPKMVLNEDGAWWGNNWPTEIESCRAADSPMVTLGSIHTNLPPEVQLAYGPNPALRKPPRGG
jgi:SAM-dependent methyltransferase